MKFRFYLLLLFSFITLFSNAQDRLKNKYLGTYTGKINSYKMETAGYLMDVSEAKIEIDLGANLMKVSVGNSAFSGPYKILFEAKDYYVLEARLVDQPVPERIIVYKRGKKISRDGLFPQPNAVLFLD
ncbi:MAG: hypothetical protein KJ941_02820 [Bacteroidetes bacterium]|nr:hypothetical protein [Bacteroidota bacterium]